MRSARALAALLASALLLAGCSLTPVYSGGRSSAAAEMIAATEIPLIEGDAGFLVRQALLHRFSASGSENAGAGGRYRLNVRLDDNITGFGVRGDDAITRESRTLRARWQLVDTTNEVTLIDATERSDAGIDVVSSEYAVVAAESDALDRLAEDIATRITARIASYASGQR